MNLTSLYNVKQWVNSTTSNDDGLLTRLIGDASRTALNYMQRADLGLTAITETISGRGEKKIQLRNWPVISVTALSIGVQVIPASSSPSNWGYFLEPVYGSTAGRPQNLGIRNSDCGVGNNGYSPVGAFPSGYGAVALQPPYSGSGGNPFVPGVGNISVAYQYGYCVQNEAQTIPASTYQVTPFGPSGAWSGDLGVTYADTGAALTAIPSGTPAAGQYVAPSNASPTSPTAYYQFAAADVSRGVLLNYNYVPFDLEQAVIEMVGERYKYRNRIGQASQSLGGQETASYLVRDMLTASIKGRLDPYKLAWGG